MPNKKLIVTIALTLTTLIASAAELKVKPGLWETTMTRTNPITGKPSTQTKKECVKESVFNPEKMMEDMQDCKLTKNELAGNTLKFTMQCNVPQGDSTISGEYETEGDTGSGKMDIHMNMAGMSMQMNMNWTTKRIGDC